MTNKSLDYLYRNWGNSDNPESSALGELILQDMRSLNDVINQLDDVLVNGFTGGDLDAINQYCFQIQQLALEIKKNCNAQ